MEVSININEDVCTLRSKRLVWVNTEIKMIGLGYTEIKTIGLG